MKGSWVTTFAVSGVILLLTLFLGLQYNWLRQAGSAERDRMQRRAEADAKNFAEDLNREIQAAYFNFQTNTAAWEDPDWTEFNERYDFWKGKTQYPELVREFIYFPKGGGPALRYDPASRLFASAELPAEIDALRAIIADRNNFRSFYEDINALVMPVHPPEREMERIVLRRTPAGEPPKIVMPENYGSLVILLNREVLTGKVLPDLATKHFPEGNFKVAVSNAGGEAIYAPAGPIESADAWAELIDLTPDNMIFFGERKTAEKVRSLERQPGVLVRERIESHTFTREENGSGGVREGKFTIQLQPGPPAGESGRTSVIAAATSGGAPWTLNVQHVAGSIDSFSRNELWKSYLIGLGIYLLLVGSIVAIVLSAMRAKRFAQRQIDFVSSVSHEFRTPLSVIYSASENLADGIASDREQVVRYGNLIKGEGRKLSAMVEQILQFAGARSGKRKFSFAQVAPSEIVASAIKECSSVLENNGFKLETAVDENLPAVNADAEAISTALQNLISNSVKYSSGSRWIRVTASNGGGTVKIAVKDRGTGVSGADLLHIFEPFYRARSVVDAQIHGSGLGLALVKEIAEAHGGKVRAASEPGKGSEFTIELPVPKA